MLRAGAQRRPEYKLRRHWPRHAARRRPGPAAQRRPEYKLRRHRRTWRSTAPRRSSLNEGRSINSGDTAGAAPCAWRTESAQRRPEYKLRRHVVEPAREGARRELLPLNEGRSINSGDTLTGSGVAPNLAALNEGRSINSGDTRGVRGTPLRHPAALNEGRSINSGDTMCCFFML